MAHPRIARADIVDGKPRPPTHRRQCLGQGDIIGDRLMLGQFDHEPVRGRAGEQIVQLIREDGVGRGVDREIEMVGNVVQPVERGADRGELERDPEADVSRLDEPVARGPAVAIGKTSQRLDADRAALAGVVDRPVDDSELLEIDDGVDLLGPLFAVRLLADTRVDLSRRDLGEGAQHCKVAAIEASVRAVAEAAEGAVNLPVRKAKRDAEMGADRQCLGHRHFRREGDAPHVRHQFGKAPLDDVVAIAVLERIGRADGDAATAISGSDRTKIASSVGELGDEGDIHAEMDSNGLEYIAQTVQRFRGLRGRRSNRLRDARDRN